MDGIDSICLLFDYQHFVDSINPSFSGNWGSACEQYASVYASECIGPNREFAAHEEFLYKVSAAGEKECKLAKWLQPIDENSFSKIKPYFLLKIYETEYRQALFKENLNQVAQYFPSDLEKLLGIDHVDVKTWVLNAVDSNSGYELKTKSVDYIEQQVLNANIEGKYRIEHIEPAAKILTNYVTHYDKEHKHIDFLVDFVKRDIDDGIKETIFKKFAEDVSGIKNWENDQFDSFASLIDFDSKSHFLAKGLLNAQKYHGYTASLDMMPYFEGLLDDEAMKDLAAGFIAKSLEKLLLNEVSANGDPEINKAETPEIVNKIEEHVINLLNKTGKLGTGLVSAIFELYKEDQSHFNGLIVDLIAVDKLLSTGLLRKLVQPLTKIEDPKVALFIATRLAQHYIPLPSETLSHFVEYLNDEDEHVSILASNLFYQKRASIPAEINDTLVEALLTLLPKTSEVQHSKIEDILDGIKLTGKLTEVQSLKRGIQNQIYDWHRAGSFEAKIGISKELFNKISDETAQELTSFFKEHLLSQNAQLIEIASSAFKELKLIETERTSEIFFEFELNNGVRFLLTAEGWDRLEEKLDDFSWDIEEYLKQIDFTDIRELAKLLNFIKDNNVSKIELLTALGGQTDLRTLYSKLLNGLITEKQSELSPSNGKALKVSVSYLVDKIKWPADYLFSLIKDTEKGSFIKLISVLEKLEKYSVSPDLIDRNGVTALEILKNLSINELLESINRVINDDHFYMTKDLGTLLEEAKQSNLDNERLQFLIETNYFNEQLLKIGYELEIIGFEPSDCEPNRLYIYKKSDKIYIETNWGVKEVVNLKPIEFEQLRQAIEDKNLSCKGTENLIYKKAAELGIGSEIRDIKPILRGSSKPLSEWNDSDFLQWRKTITQVTDDNIAEVLAVVLQTAYNAYLEKKGYPRPIQIISMLSLFKSPDGGLAQIATGEGKSLIVAMFAIIKVLQGRQVDIVTSSSVLAMRDVKDLKAFYGQLGISISHNIGDGDKEGMKSCYLADVVYGDPLHFMGDWLRDRSINVKLGRGFDLVIVDEVDNLFIDQNNMKVQLSSMLPGSEALMPIYVYMRGQAMFIASKLRQMEGQCHLEVPALTDAQKANIENFDPEVTKNEAYEIGIEPIVGYPSCIEYIKDQLTKYSEEVLFAFKENRESRPVVVPFHLEQFAQDQLPKWITALVSSFYLVEKEDYIRAKNPDPDARYSFEIIAPIDYPNTGVIQYGLQWSDALHQFLQIKHGLTMYPENVVSVFLSYLGFFNKYAGSIYGVTGTLGEQSHHEFLKAVYGVELSIIPTFIEKDLTIFPSIVVDTKEEWLQEMDDVIERQIVAQGRAALIIVETIGEVEGFKAHLESLGYDKTKIFVYGTTSADEYDVENKRVLKPGDIIIATNMAGRGTDLKISPEVKKNGGLHVIVGMFSGSIRVQDQGFGRAARQGEPGSAQVIVYLGQIQETNCKHDIINCLNKERNEKEIQKLEEDKLCRLPRLEIRDDLFNSCVEKIKEIDSPTHYKLMVGKPDKLEDKSDKVEERSIYLYEEDGKIKLRIVQAKSSQKKNPEPIDITGLLNIIDPRSANHIRTVLSEGSHSASSLNKQDYEIIHFIAALMRYTEYPEIYNRVDNKFNETVRQEGLSGGGYSDGWREGYLSMLLKNNTKFADLRTGDEINESALNKAEIRQLYELWLADRKLYNHKYEIQQLVEYFGMWLKNQDGLLEQGENCRIANETEKLQTQESFKKLFEALNIRLGELWTSIEQKKEEGKFYDNPIYVVKKAWQYFVIDQQQSGVKPEIEPKASSESWLRNWITDAYDAAVKFWEGAKRMDFGRESYNPLTPRATTLELLNNATKMDSVYAWIAYIAKAGIELMYNGAAITKADQAEDAAKVKQQYIDNTQHAIMGMQEWGIPPLDAELTFLIFHKMVSFQDALALQLIIKKEVFLKIISVMRSDVDKVVHTTEKQTIKATGIRPPEDFVNDINVTEAISNAAHAMLNATNRTGDVDSSAYRSLFNIVQSMDFKQLNFTDDDIIGIKKLIVDQMLANGINVFTIEVKDLKEEERDWAATIFAVVVGIASIYTGLWMINVFASSIFASTFGLSLVLQGVGDLVQALMAATNGNPIDFQNYINAKGMAMGISLATAGFLHFANMIPLIHDLGFLKGVADGISNSAGNPAWLLTKIAATEGAAIAASAVLQDAAEKLIDPEEIKANAEREINQMLASAEIHEALAPIYATDDFNGNTALQDDLNRRMANAAGRHLGDQPDDRTEFGIGVGANVAGTAGSAFGIPLGVGNMFKAGTQVAMGKQKNKEAMGKIKSALREGIQENQKHTLSTAAMMEQKLRKNFRDSDKVNRLFDALTKQGFVHNGEINYRECGKSQLSGELAGFNDALLENCEYIAKLSKPRDYGALRSNFISLVSGLKIAIQRQNIVKPATDFVAGEVSNFATTNVIDFFRDQLAKANAGDQPKFKNQRGKVKEEEIAQKSGLGKKPGEEGDSGQGSGEYPQNKNEQGKAPHEDTGPQGSERKVLIANDPNDFAEGGIKMGIGGLEGLSERENVRFTASTTYVEDNGRMYEVSVKSIEILSADGSTVLKRETQVEGIEIKQGFDSFGKTPGQIQDAALISKGEIGQGYDRFSFHETNDFVKNIHNQMFNQWDSQEGNLLGLNGAFSNEGFGIRFPGESRVITMDGVALSPMNGDFLGDMPRGKLLDLAKSEASKIWQGSRDFVLDAVRSPLVQDISLVVGGVLVPGVGLGMWQDPRMKEALTHVGGTALELLNHPQVQGVFYVLDGAGEMVIGAGIATVTGVTGVGLVGGSLVMLHGASQLVKGFHQLGTNRAQESVVSIGMQKAGVPREWAHTIDDGVVIATTLGGTVVLRKITERTAERVIKEIVKEGSGHAPMVARTEICPREFGLGEKLDFKLHSPVDAGDLTGKIDMKIISSEIILKDSAQFVGEFDFCSRGILIEDHAKTFTGHKYKTYILKEDMIVYRAGNTHNTLGEYYSFDNPISEIQVRIDKAIMHKWPNGKVSVVDTVYEVKIPQGTKIHVGDAANQGGFYFGGTEQIVIPEAWRIEGIKVLKSHSINKK